MIKCHSKPILKESNSTQKELCTMLMCFQNQQNSKALPPCLINQSSPEGVVIIGISLMRHFLWLL